MWPGRVSCASALTSSLARFPRAVPHLIALCPSPWRPLAYSQGHLCPAVKGHHCQQVLLPASATESQGGASDPTGPWAWLRAPRPSCSAGLDRLCDLCGVTWTRRKPGALLGAAVALGGRDAPAFQACGEPEPWPMSHGAHCWGSHPGWGTQSGGWGASELA